MEKPIFSANEKFENLSKRKKAAAFRKAAAIIDSQDHLAKRNYKDESGCACMVGALVEAAGNVRLPVWKKESEKDLFGSGKFTVVCDLDRIAPEAAKFIDEETRRYTGFGNDFSMESFNNLPQVDKATAASALRKIARAIEHGGKFGV